MGVCMYVCVHVCEHLPPQVRYYSCTECISCNSTLPELCWDLMYSLKEIIPIHIYVYDQLNYNIYIHVHVIITESNHTYLPLFQIHCRSDLLILQVSSL